MLIIEMTLEMEIASNEILNNNDTMVETGGEIAINLIPSTFLSNVPFNALHTQKPTMY